MSLIKTFSTARKQVKIERVCTRSASVHSAQHFHGIKAFYGSNCVLLPFAWQFMHWFLHLKCSNVTNCWRRFTVVQKRWQTLECSAYISATWTSNIYSDIFRSTQVFFFALVLQLRGDMSKVCAAHWIHWYIHRYSLGTKTMCCVPSLYFCCCWRRLF